MEEHELEAIIAATLASGAIAGTNSNAEQAVTAYRKILTELRLTGGVTGNKTPQIGDIFPS
jgi:hypothetical protein